MLHCYKICLHCGIEYITQPSGNYNLPHPQKYHSFEYCPTCEKARVDAVDAAFAKIPVQFRNVYVPIKEACDFDPTLKIVDHKYIFDLFEKQKQDKLEKKKLQRELFDKWVKDGSIYECYPWDGPNPPGPILPELTRVYASLWNSERNEYSKSGEITEYISDPNIHANIRQFSYLYWPSKPEEMEIKVNVRVDIKNKYKIIDYAR